MATAAMAGAAEAVCGARGSLICPRDREGSFEPQIVKKHQTRFTSMDDNILSLHAKGITNRELVVIFKEMYGADFATSLINRVTDAVIEQAADWQTRPLKNAYPIVYLDYIVIKIRQTRGDQRRGCIVGR